MRKIIAFLFFVLSSFVSIAQCSTVSVQISSSDTSLVQLYHAGFFNIPSGFANICEWEVTSFSGEIIHQETTSGGFEEQSTVIFNHSIPITDSMKVVILITNNMEGITCTMEDTLFWNELEVLPGAFIGNWDVLSGNGGVEEEITNSTEIQLNDKNIKLFPSMVNDRFQVESDLEIYAITIYNSSGQIVKKHENLNKQIAVDISNYSKGVYFVHFWDRIGNLRGVRKMIKI